MILFHYVSKSPRFVSNGRNDNDLALILLNRQQSVTSANLAEGTGWLAFPDKGQKCTVPDSVLLTTQFQEHQYVCWNFMLPFMQVDLPA